MGETLSKRNIVVFIEKRWKRNTVYVLMQNYTRVFLNIAVLHDLATVG